MWQYIYEKSNISNLQFTPAFHLHSAFDTIDFYVSDLEIQKFSDSPLLGNANLAGVQVNGKNVPDFSGESCDAEYKIEGEFTEVVIDVYPEVDKASSKVSEIRVLPGAVTIEVFSYDGMNSNTYTLNLLTENSNISRFEEISLEVPEGTPVSDINLPTEVTAKLENGRSADVAVNSWDTSGYLRLSAL